MTWTLISLLAMVAMIFALRLAVWQGLRLVSGFFSKSMVALRQAWTRENITPQSSGIRASLPTATRFLEARPQPHVSEYALCQRCPGRIPCRRLLAAAWDYPRRAHSTAGPLSFVIHKCASAITGMVMAQSAWATDRRQANAGNTAGSVFSIKSAKIY